MPRYLIDNLIHLNIPCKNLLANNAWNMVIVDLALNLFLGKTNRMAYKKRMAASWGRKPTNQL